METVLSRPTTARNTQWARERIARAKVPYAARRVPRKDMATLLTGSVRPCAGNLVLARVQNWGSTATLN
jgi:hypothetical protein